MATTRNKRRALGAAAPDLENLDTYAAAAARTRKNKTANESGERSKAREGSIEMDIPGTFTPSPLNDGKGSPQPEHSTDEMEERHAEAHISIAMGESTDEEKSDSCPPGESSDDESSPRVEHTGFEPCPTGSPPEPGRGPLHYTEEWDNEASLGYSSTPPFSASEQTLRNENTQRTTTPFRTPSRTSRAPISQNTIQLDGAKYFPQNSFNTNDAYIENVCEPENESRSDETLKQHGKPKRRSEAQQRAEDLAFLNAVIKDNKRRRRLQEVLPDIIPNNKSLLDEMREVLEKSSRDEYQASEWEYVPESPKAGPSIEVWRANEATSAPKLSEKIGPSYFDKGKWVSDEVHDVREAYKAARRRAEASEDGPRDEGRKETAPKHKNSKKARPSIGITIDEIRPLKSRQKVPEMLDVAPNLKASIAALPGGGYLANQMREKSINSGNMGHEKNSKHSSKDSTTSRFGSSSSSSDDSSSSDPGDSSSCSSSDASSVQAAALSQGQKRTNEKNRDKYCEKMRKLRKKMRKERRVRVQLIEPKPYLGQSDYDEFELWAYEVDLWLKDSGYKGQKAVRYMGNFLSKKAAQWYMDHVAPNPQAYTPDAVKMGLFAYCFPPDMKSKLREEFKNAQQGSKRFVDYLRELKRYQRCIPDITDKQLCIKLWDTVPTYIKIKWVEAGLNAEESELSALSEAAERFEAAEEVKRKLEARREAISKPKHGTFKFKPERHAEGRKPTQLS